MAGGFYKIFADQIKDVDGTVAMAFSNPEDLSGNLRGVVTTTGEPGMELKTTLSNWAPIRVEGKLIRMTKGEMAGTLPLDEIANEMGDACVAMASDMPIYPFSEMNAYPLLNNAMSAISYYIVTFEPEDGSLEMKFEIKGKNKGENFLMSLLKASAATQAN